MATGCCGVKKQKLNSVVVSTRNGERGLWSKGFINRSSDRSNSVDIQAISRDYGECSSTSNYDRQTLSPRLAGRQPRIVCCDMVVFCFDVLHSYLYSSEPPRTPQFTNDQFPLFVTWKMGKDKKLRGCIGTFNSTSLHDGLREYAVTSACKDSRFEPINANEFARLHCSVSLLMDFEVADHYLDWEIGVHGIRIEFISEKGSKKAATYLPEVAIEQGWNQVQTIDSLLRKGGFKGTITSEIRGSLCLIRFQSEKMTVSYSEYLTHKKLSASATFTKQNLQTVTTILPPLKPPISNGEAALPKNFMNGQLSATCGSPPSIGIHQRDRFSFSHKYRHEHNSQHSLVPPMNGALYEHHPATPSTQWWRNHTTNDQYIHMNGRSQRHPQFDGDSCRGPNHQCILPQTLR